MKNVEIIGDYRIEFFRNPDGSWNWRAYSIWTARTSPYVVANARYRTKKDAKGSASDWVSRQED